MDWGCFDGCQIGGYAFFVVVDLLGSELRIVGRHMHPICRVLWLEALEGYSGRFSLVVLVF